MGGSPRPPPSSQDCHAASPDRNARSWPFGRIRRKVPGTRSVSGWVVLPHVPVQTQVDQLLAQSLPQLRDINTVRDQTGYANEVDIYLRGQVAGPYNQAGSEVAHCQVMLGGVLIRTQYPDQVVLATSIADFFIASSPSAAPGAAASTHAKNQTLFLCDLRLLPDVARSLVQEVPTTTQPCPAVDKYLNTWLSIDAATSASTSRCQRAPPPWPRWPGRLRRAVRSPPPCAVRSAPRRAPGEPH